MNTQVMIVLMIGLLMIIAFSCGKFSFPAVAVTVIVTLEILKILPSSKAWAGFSSSTAVLFAAMFILAAGLGRTSLLDKLSAVIVPEGSSERRAVVGCGLLSIILTIFSNTSSTMATLMPVCFNVAKKAGISPKRLLKPAVDLSSIWVAVLPVGGGLMTYSNCNAIMSSIGGTPSFDILTFMIARLPIVTLISLFIFGVGYKLCPKNYDNVDYNGMADTAGAKAGRRLEMGKERLAYVIFVGTIVAMIASNYVRLISTSACAVIGALLMVYTGILTEKEAMRAVNLKVISIYCGTIALANALGESGATEVISDFMNRVLGSLANPYIIAFVFVMATCICTQFMNNSSTLNIFRILGAVVAVACGFDARAILIAVEMGATCSVITPMASATQAMVFAQGGYTMKEYFKVGIVIFLIYITLFMIWVPNIFPAL